MDDPGLERHLFSLFFGAKTDSIAAWILVPFFKKRGACSSFVRSLGRA